MKKILIVLASVGAAAVLYLLSPYRTARAADDVLLVQPRVSAIQDTVTLHGTVIDPERRRLYVQGVSTVQAVYVQPGDLVEEGQLLMRLEKQSDLQSEQAAMASALGELREQLEGDQLSEAGAMLAGMLSFYENGPILPENTPQVYELYSPVSGMVMRLSAKAGQQVGPLLPCIEISSLSDLMVEADAGEEVIGRLAEHMPCTISVPAFSLSNLSGEVQQIRPYAQTTGGFLTGERVTETSVLCSVQDPTGTLRPGYRATAQVLVSVREQSVLVPYEAVGQDEHNREYVLKAQEGRVVKQPVVTGAELREEVEVVSGVDPEDLLILYPQADMEGEAIHVASQGSSGPVG